MAREYLEPLRQEGLDTLILGCTHYPLLTDIIGDIMGPDVTLINASEEGVWELKRTLRSMDLLAPEKQAGQATLCASDQPEDFGALASYFLRETAQENLAVMNTIKTALDPKHTLNDQKSYIMGGK